MFSKFFVLLILVNYISSLTQLQSKLSKLLSTSCSASGTDLSSLAATTDYSFSMPSATGSTNTLHMNVCANTNIPCSGSASSPIYYNFGSTANACFQLGQLSTAVWTDNTVSYSMGDSCPASTTAGKYTSAITFVCDSSNKGPGITASVVTQCNYAVTFSTSLMCGGSKPGDTSEKSADVGSIVFISVFFAGFGIYFIGGMIYNYKNRSFEGESVKVCDLIPNKDFWLFLPGLMYDGILYSIYLFKLSLFKCTLLKEEPIFELSSFSTSGENSSMGSSTGTSYGGL